MNAVACIALLAATFACSGENALQSQASQSEEPAATVVRAYRPPPEPRVQSVSDRRLIRTADLDVTVDDPAQTAARIQELAESSGGYLGSTTSQRRGTLPRYEITVYVPATDLENALARIKEMANSVERERVRAVDATDQVIDVDARLRTLSATEAELQALLTESRARDHTVEDVMAVYRELTGIRSQNEQLQAQLEGLERRVALSTINVVVASTPTRDVGIWSAASIARNSARTLVRALQALAGLVIFLVIVVLPITCAVGIPIWGTTQLRQWARQQRLSS